MKIQADSSLEPPLEYNLGSYRNIMQFQISSRREIAKELPESSRYEFLAKFLANIFALSDAKENTLGPLN